RYAASPDQFATIALLRAARMAWGRVSEVCGVGSEARGQRQHAVTSALTWTRRDPYVNLLRGTISAFAAGVGGADAVTVAPFDAALRPPASFSRRIAGNTQTLLIAESHVAAVIDPAGGSWYVEQRTVELAEAAWAFFQELETAGGAVPALDSGMLAERLAAVAERRQRAVATRQTPLIGVSEFADPAETLLPGHTPSGPGRSGGLPRIRLAAPYEELRDRADAAAEHGGRRPRVFLASLGPVGTHAVRVQFVRNLLQAGGIEAPDAGPTADVPAVATAFAAERTPVAVLCASDRLYAERAADTVVALRQAGASLVLLAGKPSDPPVPGIDGYLSAGGDALGVLEQVWTALAPREAS
ncbi:MAG: methylmalonyl-CoA mutase, partial [Geodermatophilaceae bacterium]|nr:methylmalonyl-CoA mutase [Geodermatophilaceae bacterium]